MKILMVSSFLPYPLFSGGHIRLYNLMKSLKKEGHHINLVCEKRSYQKEAEIKKVLEVCEKVLTVDRKKQWSIENILKAGFSTHSFLTVGHNLPRMKKLIKEELEREKYDLIHVETFYVNQNVPKSPIPLVLVEHNIEYLVYKRFVEKSPVFLRPLLSLDVIKMKREEESFWKKAKKLVAVSQADQKVMKIDSSLVKNGVDTKKFDLERKNKAKGDERLLLFIGDFKCIQNQDAVSFLLKSVWPSIRSRAQEKGINAKFWVVGKRIPSKIRDLGGVGIIFDENAPSETEEIYNRADILLAPIRVGGGTSFKILESMASGLPVITTRLGIEGIDGRDGRDVLIAESSEEYVEKALDLLENNEKYDEISENSRKYIKENFDWENISKKLEEVYKAAVL